MTSVLLVDDSESDRFLIGNLIERQKDYAVRYAEGGREALEQMGRSPPDVVVTDLMMPGMDGLELVAAVRQRYPHTPVVLTTGQGTERIAVEALQKGAASYVPKSKIQQMLIETIEQVVETVESDRSYQRLIGSMARTRYGFVLENDPLLIPPLVDLLQQMTFGMSLCDATERRRVGIALGEALLNAMYHGNLELDPAHLPQARAQLRRGSRGALIEQRQAQQPFCDRRVFVEAAITPEQARFTVRDQGSGFRTGGIPEAGDPQTLERQGGRGLVLMKNFMDRVWFNKTGNEIVLEKTRQS